MLSANSEDHIIFLVITSNDFATKQTIVSSNTNVQAWKIKQNHCIKGCFMQPKHSIIHQLVNKT